MTKINQEEYEILKGLQTEGYSWLCRDKEGNDKTGWLWTTEPKPIKYEEYDRWITVNNTALQGVDENLFQFIQWEDEEPHNVAELIKEYEFGKILLAMAEEETVLELECESEGTEVKKDIEWLKEEIGTEMIQLEPNRKERWSDVKYQTLRNVAQKINQLDETEVLSQEWIQEKSVPIVFWAKEQDVILVKELQNLLVPKQEITEKQAWEKIEETYSEEALVKVQKERLEELGYIVLEKPTIPEFVAEFLIGKEDYMLYELFDEEWLYKEHDRVAKWLYDNDEYINREREADLTLAHINGYEVEEEPKYYVLTSSNKILLTKDDGVVRETYQAYSWIKERDKEHYQLTEQEIKDYDPGYWAFRKPVEELE